MKPAKPLPWVVRPLVPEEVYTDREEFLEYFYEAALKAGIRRTMSTVLLGQRRMGKTEIFKRVVNRLFFSQDPEDPLAVVPVYYSFPDQSMDVNRFAEDYIENVIRYYVAFYTRQPGLIEKKLTGKSLLGAVAESRKLFSFPEQLDWLLEWYDAVCRRDTPFPERDAVESPRRVSDSADSTIVVFLDEFQNTRLPQYDFSIVGFMQEAVESPTCPHFVTGSAMSILAREIIGRGALFGRFRSQEIKAMTEYHGAELAMKAARYNRIDLPEIMAPVIAERCGGNPFYITAVIQQAAEQNAVISDEETLNRILAVDISSGFIWGELHDQVTRWIQRINEKGITKWILYLSALDENTEEEKRGRLNVEKIRDEIREREKKDVSLEEVRDVLVRLSRGDLIEYLELGGWFRRVKDPILLEFLRVWGRTEVAGKAADEVQQDLMEKYQHLERRIREYKGYLAEIHMGQVLWNAQRKTLPGRFFNSKKDVKMPDMFIFVEHRHRPGSGKGREMDVLGAAGAEQWICQSKWTEGRKSGIKILEELLAQGEILRDGKDYRTIRLWIFSHGGLTKQAENFARKHGIFWSARKEFDELLEYVGLRKLPELKHAEIISEL